MAAQLCALRRRRAAAHVTGTEEGVVTDWPFAPLIPLSYDVIIADPPWSYDRWSDTNQSKGAADQYETMEAADVARLPVGHLARGDCLLLLWACGCMLPQA